MNRNSSNKSWKNFSKILSSIVLIALFLSPSASSSDVSGSASSTLEEVYQLIKQNHVSGASEEQLTNAAIDGMIRSLGDPYTEYFSKEEWAKFQGSLDQNYVGIGVRLGEDSSGYFIDEVFEGSPAAEAGLKEGDKIIAVNGNSVKGKKLSDLVKVISGPEGSTVVVTIERQRKSIIFKVSRATIQLPSVTDQRFPGDIGYIRISGFGSDADEKFGAKLKSMKENGLRSLIVDLRDNPGGYLDTALNIAKQFIQNGTLIHTKDNQNVDKPVYIHGGSSVQVPVIVMVNGNSASASEVLTGALQDYKAARAVGTKTYGKGSVQNLIPLSNGGVLKVTVQEYLTPNMRTVNRVGLKPDVEVSGEAAQLITALRLAGAERIDLTFTSQELWLNGISVGHIMKVLTDKQNVVYVPSSVLSAMIQGQLKWNGSAKAIEITAGKLKGTFTPGTPGVKMENGVSYIELNRFQKIFPQLTKTIHGDRTVLKVNKG